jgi:hypothetical protein
MEGERITGLPPALEILAGAGGAHECRRAPCQTGLLRARFGTRDHLLAEPSRQPQREREAPHGLMPSAHCHLHALQWLVGHGAATARYVRIKHRQ